MLLFVALISLCLSVWAAYSISELVHQREDERQQEIEDAKLKVIEEAVSQCLSRNQARAEDKVKDSYFVNFIISLSRDPDTAVQSLQPLLDFYETANDPLDCNYNSPTFGEDTTPPPTIQGL